MSRINILDEKTANAIKAGEVIERPVSVVKELVDNSVDAGASSVRIEFENGGISLIRVSDNGIGMDEEDARRSFLLHATSKISSAQDIYDLSTFGFRGEALASVAACADVSLTTRQSDMKTGVCVEYEGGKFKRMSEVSADTGTVVTVKELFANMPARYKFLKRDATEGMYICSLTEKLAVINPQVSFKLVKDGKQILSTPGNGNMKDAIYAVYGKELTSSLVPVEYEREGLKLKGFTGKPSYVRGNRGMQYVYVNDRPVRSTVVTAAIDEAYKGSVMKHKYPVCMLCIYVPAGGVDVNVHPQKAEVKFADDSEVFRLVLHGIKNALFGEGPVLETPIEERPEPAADKGHIDPPADNYRKVNNAKTSGGSLRPSYTPAAQTKTDDLLKILSAFKPDINEIAEEIGEEKAGGTQIPDEGLPVKFDAPVNADNDISELLSSEFVGFLFSTYIVMQSGDAMFLVDQHAAHERVLFERFGNERDKTENSARQVETLLVPQIIELSASDISFVADNIEYFREYGFDIDIAGERQLALRSVPVATRSEDRLKSMSKPSVFFKQILDDLKRETPDKSHVWVSLIQTTACKAAVKAHERITREEALSLIQQLGQCQDPCHCAHGRPTFFKMTQTEIEKKFKRIV